MDGLDGVRGRRLVIGIDSRSDSNMEAARILRDAIEANDSYAVVRCITSAKSKTLADEGLPQTLGDVMLAVSDESNGPYELFMIMAMMLEWVEETTQFPRPIVVRSMMAAAKVLDKLKGGRDGVEPSAGPATGE